MRTSQKIIISVVIAVLTTGGFALIAYTGLFRLLETDFFSSRVASDQSARLEDISNTILLWNQENLSRFDALARDRNMQSVFSISQRQEEIFYRAQMSDSLKDQLLGFNGIRIVDNDGKIHFSSFAGDISSRQDIEGRIFYRNWNETNDSFELAIAGEDSIALTYYDEANQRVRYQLPIQDWGFVTRGWMIVYMGLSGLTDRLARDGEIAQGANLYVVEGRGIIADIRPEQVAAVKEEIDILWSVDGVSPEFSVLAKGLDGKYWLGGTISGDGTLVGKLIPGNLFGFSDSVRILIFATMFLTSALLVFLLFNLRQDRTEVLRGRINRLQVNLMRDWLEHHENRKLSPNDFEARREEVRVELRQGLGKLGEDESTKADKIIDEGWTRIVEALTDKVSDIEAGSVDSSTVVQQEPIDMKLLEDMIARAISAAQIAAPRIQQPLQPIGEESAEPEEISEVEDELAEVEELSGAAEGDEVIEELPELESDETPLDDAGELAGVRGVGPLENQTGVRRDDEVLLKSDAVPEVFGVLPVVLADDFGELLEIDNVKQSRLYMFDGAPNPSCEDVTDNLETLDRDDEGADDLEEVDEPDAADKSDLKPESVETSPVDGAMLIPIAEIVKRYHNSRPAEAHDGKGNFAHSDSIESLIKTNVTGILPGVKSDDKNLPFAHKYLDLGWQKDGLDYDRYLQNFEPNSTGIYKALMKLSKECGAICGALFLSSKKGLVTNYAVGLSEGCAAQLSVRRSEKLWTEWFERRLAVFIPELSNSPYASKTGHYEFRYVRAASLIPIIYAGTPSYLFLGFKEVPEDFMKLLVGADAAAKPISSGI